MNDEIAKMQLQLERLSDELRNANTAIRGLESRTAWRRPHVAMIVVFVATVALFVNSWNTKASNGTGHTQLAADEKTTIIKAPLEVDDDNGNPIMIVRDQANGNDPRYPRGLYITDQSKKAVIKLGATDDDGGGGSIIVTETGPGITATGGQVNGIEISGAKEKSGIRILRGGKSVASMSAQQSDKNGIESGGSIQLFNSAEKPTLTLSTAKTGGQLSIYDAKNKKAATLTAETSGGALSIFGSGEKKKATLGTESDGGALKIYGAGDTPKGTFTTDTEGGSLKIYGSGDRAKASLAVESDGGVINVYGSSEKADATLKSDGGYGKLSILNTDGKSLADVVGDPTGGIVRVTKKDDPTTYTSINAIEAGTGLKVRKAGANMVFAGVGAAGGNVITYNEAGAMVTSITTLNGKGLISVIAKDQAIAFMTESVKHPGGGNFTATDPGGFGIFSAGFTGEGADVCIDRKSSLKCLGIGLPLTIDP